MDHEQLVVASVFARADTVLALCVMHPCLGASEIPEFLAEAASDLVVEHPPRRLRIVLYQPHASYRFLEVSLEVFCRDHRVSGNPVTDTDLLGLFEKEVAGSELVIAYPEEFAPRGLQ